MHGLPPDVEEELGPISPELCLVDPELARAARARLPVREAEAEADVVRVLQALRKPDPRRALVRPRAPALPRPRVHAQRPRPRRAPRVLIAGAALLACLPFLPATSVRGAEPVRDAGAPETVTPKADNVL